MFKGRKVQGFGLHLSPLLFSYYFIISQELQNHLYIFRWWIYGFHRFVTPLINALIFALSLSAGFTAIKLAYGELSSSKAIESFTGESLASIAKFELMITASPSLFRMLILIIQVRFLFWFDVLWFSAMSLNPAVTGFTPSFNLINPALWRSLRNVQLQQGLLKHIPLRCLVILLMICIS